MAEKELAGSSTSPCPTQAEILSRGTWITPRHGVTLLKEDWEKASRPGQAQDCMAVSSGLAATWGHS